MKASRPKKKTNKFKQQQQQQKRKEKSQSIFKAIETYNNHLAPVYISITEFGPNPALQKKRQISNDGMGWGVCAQPPSVFLDDKSGEGDSSLYLQGDRVVFGATRKCAQGPSRIPQQLPSLSLLFLIPNVV